MRKAVFLYLTSLSFFWGFGQENQKYFTKDYIFETEYQYRNIEKDTILITFQFTKERFLKINFSNAGEFMLIDAEGDFMARNFNGGVELKKNSELPAALQEDKFRLERKGTINYKDYHCDIYHIILGNDLLKFYFDKKESENFNSLIAKILALRGLQIDENTIPKGKLIAGMEVKQGKDIDVMELVSTKENQNIRFKLKTNQ